MLGEMCVVLFDEPDGSRMTPSPLVTIFSGLVLYALRAVFTQYGFTAVLG